MRPANITHSPDDLPARTVSAIWALPVSRSVRPGPIGLLTRRCSEGLRMSPSIRRTLAPTIASDRAGAKAVVDLPSDPCVLVNSMLAGARCDDENWIAVK